MCQYSMEIYLNIALVFRDALYLVEERSKEIRRRTGGKRRKRDRKSERERYSRRISTRIAVRNGNLRGSGRWGWRQYLWIFEIKLHSSRPAGSVRYINVSDNILIETHIRWNQISMVFTLIRNTGKSKRQDVNYNRLHFTDLKRFSYHIIIRNIIL